MPKVLRIINRINLGGPIYNAAYLSAHLAPEFETMLVAGMKEETEESAEFILDKLKLQPHYVHSMRREINLWDDRKAYQEIRALIRYFKPDIVHTHAAKAGALGREAAHHEKVPVILHTFHGHIFHSYFNPLKTRIFLEIERRMARHSTGIIAISSRQKEELAEVYRICEADKIKIIPLGFDLERFTLNKELHRASFRTKYNLDDDTLAVGIIGRLVPIKNHSLFLKSWKNIFAAYGHKVHAFIIGAGEDRVRLEELCTALGLHYNTADHFSKNASVTFTGRILDIETALAGLDVVALSSNNEGTPVSLIEAQAAGKPIVSTDVGGLRDTVLPDQTALIVPPDNIVEFTAGLTNLIERPSLRESMSKLGPAFANPNFGIDKLVANMRQYYHELLLQSGAARAMAETATASSHKPQAVSIPQPVRPLKVMQIVNRLNLGGITYNAASIAARLRPGFETMIVSGMKEDSEESSEFILKNLGLEPVYIRDMMREINIIRDRSAYLQLLKLIRQFKPDIVHTHAAKAGMLGRLAAYHAGVPVIVHTFHGHVFHSYFGPLKTRFFLETERFLGRISSGIIAISDFQKHELSEVYRVASPEKFRVVELGYDLEPFQLDIAEKRKNFRKRFNLRDDSIAVGMIGRIVPVKNVGMFIESWQQLQTIYGDKVHAFLVGDGEDRQKMEVLCRKLNIRFSTPEASDTQASLTFTSWIHEADVVMAGLDIVALTSLNEGTPASLIEAQAAGKPIISTRVGGIPDIVEENKTALLVSSGNVKEFVEGLSYLINHEAIRNAMSQRGPQIAISRFHYTRLVDDMRNLYIELHNSGKRAGRRL